MFIGSRHCPRCGAAAAIAETTDAEPRLCPRCRTEMNSVVIGAANLRQCLKCDGLWVDVRSFEKICADREQQSAVLGAASTMPQDAAGKSNKVRYVPCPECAQLMNRVNFARCSGVVVDVCKRHGTWFDRDELSSIVEFIRGGGMNSARAKERIEIAEERERLRQEQLALDTRQSSSLGIGLSDDHRVSGIASARGLLKFLLD
ncbi:MAG: zf-TFIIB domain-containing protein [Acidobacteriota bacterium]